MKNKTPLVLIEQILMVLVFALSAAVCLRAFVWAGQISKGDRERDQAMLQAQSAAELLKSCRGDYAQAAERYGGSWDGAVWTICYNESWEQSAQAADYVLQVTPEPRQERYLGCARVEVRKAPEECLARLSVGWQEDSDG